MWNIVRSLSINKLVAEGSWKREGLMWIYLLADQSSTPAFFDLDFGFFDVCLLDISMLFYFFEVICVDFEVTNCLSKPQKWWFFLREILTFLKNQVFVLEDWFGSFLTLFWAHFGVLMGFLGLLDRSNGVCRILFFYASLS